MEEEFWVRHVLRQSHLSWEATVCCSYGGWLWAAYIFLVETGLRVTNKLIAGGNQKIPRFWFYCCGFMFERYRTKIKAYYLHNQLFETHSYSVG